MNKFKRALSSLLAFTMVLSMITVMNVSSVFAAVTPSSDDGLNTYSESKTFTFENDTTTTLTSTKNEYTSLNNGLLYAEGSGTSESKIVTVTADSDSVGNTAGYKAYFLGANGDNGKCALIFKAETAGTVYIKARYTESTERSARITIGSTANDFTLKSTIDTYSVQTSADQYVYITSRTTRSDVAIYEVGYTTASTEAVSVDLTVTDKVTSTSVTDFTVTDSSSNIVSAGTDGKYSLYSGASYTVSADGYADTTFTATSDTEQSITLKPIYNVTLYNLPEGAEITDSDGNVVSAGTDGRYKLVYSDTYTVSGTGFATFTFDVDSDSITLPDAKEYSTITGNLSMTFSANTSKGEDLGNGVYTVGALNYTKSDSSQTIYNGTAFGKKFDGYLTSSTNPVLSNDGIPTDGAAIKLLPGTDGVLTVYFYTAASKQVLLAKVDSSGNVSTSTVYTNPSSDLGTNAYFTTAVESGCTYYVYVNSSKLRFYGVDFTTDDYYYANFTENDVNSWNEYSVVKNTDNEVVAKGTEVYEGIDLDGNETADVTPADGYKYIVAFIVKDANGATDIQNHFSVVNSADLSTSES